MPYDGMVLAAVKKELEQALTGLRIDKIQQPAREEIHLVLGGSGAKYRLLLSADPGMARVHLTGRAGENPPSPPVFCMVLRKHLEGGRISGFSQPGYDRTLAISVDARDEVGRRSAKQIICELMGKHSNIILTDPVKGIILDGIKRYSHAVSRHREVLPGRPYLPPPGQGKINPLSLDEGMFFNIMTQGSLTGKTSDKIQRIFDGLSPAMAREAVWRSGLDPDTPLEVMGEIDLVSLLLTLKDIYTRAEKGLFEPALVYGEAVPRDFAAFGLTHLRNTRWTSGSMNEVVDSFYGQKAVSGKMEALRQSILSVVKRETSRLEKKLAAQTADLDSAAGADGLKLSGELIKANIHNLKKGDTEVLLENFYDQGCPQVKVSLDPRLSPAENAQAYFRKYGKAKKVLESAALHAETTRANLEYMAGVEYCAESASSREELEEIRAELVEQGFMKTSGPRPIKRREKEQPKTLVFLSCDGLTILAGRNNRQNDYLTMRLAGPEDIWLHAREIPGSHVVIRTGGKKVPLSTLGEAASLAALFSRAGRSSKVPVDYTLRRNVSKPRGAKPGFVIYTDFKTIITDPDPSLPERLTQETGKGSMD